MVLDTEGVQTHYRNRRTGQIQTETISTEGGLHFPCESPVSPFFTRRLNPGMRPFAAKPKLLCSPATGRALIFPELAEGTEFPVRGVAVNLASLLGSSEEAGPFSSGGAALIVRQAPPDYHRCYFPDDGHAGAAAPITGCCQSADASSRHRIADLFHRNRCAITPIDTVHFGHIAYVEIGVFAVGSIVQTYAPGPVVRGQEKGYFRCGGCTLVLLFGPDAIRFDEDLVRDSAAGLEVQVRTGEQIGTTAGGWQ